jgi:hypothetical protein
MDQELEALKHGELQDLRAFEAKRDAYFAEQHTNTRVWFNALKESLPGNLESTERTISYLKARVQAQKAYTVSLMKLNDVATGAKKGSTQKAAKRAIKSAPKTKSKVGAEKERAVAAANATADAVQSQNADGQQGHHVIEDISRSDVQFAIFIKELAEFTEKEVIGKLETMHKDYQKEVGQILKKGSDSLATMVKVNEHGEKCFEDLQKILSQDITTDIRGGGGSSKDAWLADSNYRCAVKHQYDGLKHLESAMGGTFQKIYELELRRKTDIRSSIESLISKQGEVYARVPEMNATLMACVHNINLNPEAIREDIQRKVTKVAEEEKVKVSASPDEHGNIAPSAIRPDDPAPVMNSKLISHAAMVERKGATGWTLALAVLTKDGYMHLFDIPSSKKTGLSLSSSPVDAYAALEPDLWKADAAEEGQGIKLSKSLSSAVVKPTVTVAMCNNDAAPKALKNREGAFELVEHTPASFPRSLISKEKKRPFTFRAASTSAMEGLVLQAKLTDRKSSNDPDELMAEIRSSSAPKA